MCIIVIFSGWLRLSVVLFFLSPSVGQKRNPQLAGLVTGSGPQDKQPFMVAFFRANEVRFRSIRSAHGHKGRQSNRSKPQRTVQDALKAVEAATGTWTLQISQSWLLVLWYLCVLILAICHFQITLASLKRDVKSMSCMSVSEIWDGRYNSKLSFNLILMWFCLQKWQTDWHCLCFLSD